MIAGIGVWWILLICVVEQLVQVCGILSIVVAVRLDETGISV